MSSLNKKKKLKNSYCTCGVLKDKNTKLKRVLFFNSSVRQEGKRKTRNEVNNED